MPVKILLALAALAYPVLACCADQPVLKNWFGDPFIQVSNAMPACPVPLGPLMAEADIRQEEHGRVERGTTCWLSGKCAKPNAYMYDQEIARQVLQRFAQSKAFADTSLWVTVKRKFVWVEGCIADQGQEAGLQKLLQDVPEVEHVLVNVMPGVAQKPPYEVRP